MMDIEIKNRFTGEIIVSGKYESLRNAVEKNGANLCGANLCGANLYRAKGINLPIISLAGTAHHFQYINGHIAIGCEFYHLEYWLIMYEAIGRENNYTPEQIAEYGRYIKMCKQAVV